MPLSDIQIRNLKSRDKAYRLSDGGNLCIEVKPNGSKLWKLFYRVDGKMKTMSFGAYPEVSLARARERRLEAKAMLADGIDPMTKAKADREEKKALTEHTFAAIAEELLEKGRKEGLAQTTLDKKTWLLGMANEDLGPRPIREITAAEILKPLQRVQAEGNYESARRLRSIIGQVFRYAVATARADNDPTYALRGALVTPKVTHRAALTSRDSFEGLIRAIWAYQGAIETQAALKLLALLYPRPGELRLAKWPEFDLGKAIWTIPAERTKMRRAHTKPLPALAVGILQNLKQHTGNHEFAFPSQLSPGKPISENTLNGALRRLGFSKEEHTSHGFRASASSLLNESGKWSADAIEAELAHIGADQIRKAYHRARYWDERTRMSEWWSGLISELILTD
jgi:integrase